MASNNYNLRKAPSWPDIKKCPDHKKKYKLISLDECEKPNLIFKCKKCIKEPNEKMMNVSEFLYSTDRHVFDHLPGISNEL